MIFADFPEIGTRENFDGVHTRYLTIAVQKKISSRTETKESVVCPRYATWPASAAAASVLIVANLSRLTRRRVAAYLLSRPTRRYTDPTTGSPRLAALEGFFLDIAVNNTSFRSNGRNTAYASQTAKLLSY